MLSARDRGLRALPARGMSRILRGVILLRRVSFLVGRQHGIWEASEVSALVSFY